MAKYSNQVNYKISTSLDNSGIKQLQNELNSLMISLNKLDSQYPINQDHLKQNLNDIQKLKHILNDSFNVNLGMLDNKKFAANLKDANISLSNIKSEFLDMGSVGAKAYTTMLTQIGKIDTGTRQISKTTDKIFNTIGNTVRWGLVSSAFNSIMNGIHSSAQYMQDLDKSLTNIRIVSDYSAEAMRDFSIYANEAAKALGQTTVAFTDATEIFAAQGYALEESQRLAEMTLKISNITGQSTSETSEQLTSWINGYQMTIDQAEKTMDKVTAIAAWGAADTEELMTAASKVASVASTLGVTEDQLISQMSTIISVTREAPETVGNALKTLYARLGDLSLGETLEDGVTLGKLSGTLEQVGVEVLDINGNMRSMGTIIEDLMDRWDNFSAGQKQSLAVLLAGKQQYARFMSLMENDEMYQTTLNQSMNQSAGYLDKAQSIYMDSFEAKLQTLQASMEGIYTNLFNPDQIKPFIGVLTSVLDLFNQMIKATGGFGDILLGIGSTAVRVFHNQIGRSIQQTINNYQSMKTAKENKESLSVSLANAGFNRDYIRNTNVNENAQNVGTLENFVYEKDRMAPLLSEEQVQEFEQQTQRIKTALDLEIEANERVENSVTKINLALSALGIEEQAFNDNGQLNLGDLGQYYEDAKPDSFLPDKEATEILRAKSETTGQSAASLLKDTMARVNEAQGILLDLKDGVYKSDEEIKNAKNKLDQLLSSNSSDDIGSLMNDLRDVFGDNEIISKIIDEYMVTLETFDSQLQNGELGDAGEELEGKLKTLEQSLVRTVMSIDTDIPETLEDTAKLNQQVQEAKETLAAESQRGAAMIENAQKGIKIGDITNTVGAISQLAFTWREFQNLGSLFANNDISEGERLIQIITNLSITVPSLISSFSNLKKSMPSTPFFQNYKQNIEENTKRKQETLNNARKDYNNALIGFENAFTEKEESQKDLQEKASKRKNFKEWTPEQLTKNKELLESSPKDKQLRKNIKLQEEYAEAKKKVTQTTENATKASNNLQIAEENLRNAQNDLNDATKETSNTFTDWLKKGLSSVSVGQIIGIASMVASAIGFIDSAIRQAKESAASAAKETAQSTLEEFNSYSEAANNYQDLYEQWKKGEIAQSDFVDQAKELNETLKIQGGDALLAAGHFDTFTKAINNNAEAQRKNAENQVTNAVVAQESSNNNGFLGSTYNSPTANLKSVVAGTSITDTKQGTENDYDTKVYSNPSSNVPTYLKIEDYGLSEDSKNKFNELQSKIRESESGLSAIRLTQQLVDFLLEEQSKMDKNSDAYAEFSEKITALQGELGQTENASLLELGNQQLELAAQSAELQEKLAGQNNVDDIEKIFNSDEVIANYLDTLDDRSEILEWMIQHTDDEAAKTALMMNQMNQIDQNKSKYEEKIKSLTNITEEEEIKLRAVLSDASDTKALEILEAIKSGKPIEEVLELTAKFNTDENDYIDNDSHYTSEEKSKFLEDRKMTDEDFDQLRDRWQSMGIEDFSKQNELGAKSAKEAAEATRQYGIEMRQAKQEMVALEEAGKQNTEEYENAKNAYDLASRKLSGYNENLDDVIIATQIAEESLADLAGTFEENAEYIREGISALEEGKQATKEYYDAISDIQTQLSGIFGQDVSDVFDADFITQAENLELIGRAAQGDTEAIQELQNKLQELRQEAVVKILTEIDSQPLWDTWNNDILPYLDQLQGYEIGTVLTMDESEFVNKLNELVQDFTPAQVEAINSWLRSIGYTPVIKTQTVTTKQTVSVNFPTGFNIDPNDSVASLALGSVDYKDATSTIDVTTEVPYFESITRTGGGSGTAYSPSNYKAPKSSGGGGKSGGSKSPKSSSGSKYEPKTKDPIEEEYDRYKKVNHQLEKNGNQLKTLTTHQERLVQGSNEWLKSTEKRVELINKEIGLNKEKLSIAEQEQKELKDYLAGQGVQFDAEGFFLNGKEIQDKLVKSVNDAINKYNSSTTEADQDYWEKAIKEREEALKTYQENLDRYAEVHGSLIPELIDQLEELEDQIEDIRIDIVKNGLEAVNTLKDMTEKANEFNAVFAGIGKKDNPFRALSVDAKNLEGYLKADKKAMDLFYQSMNQKANDKDLSDAMRNAYKEGIARSKQAEADGRIQAGDSGYLGLIQQYTDVALEQLQQLNDTGTSSIFGKNSEEAYQFAQDVADQAMEMLIQFEEAFEQMHEDILDAIGYMADYTEDRLALYDDLTEQMEYIADLSTIMYGTSDLALNNALLEKKTDILRQQNNEIRASRAEYQNLLDVQNKELANLKANGASRQEIEYAMERQKALQEEVNKLTQQEHDNVLAIAKIREEIRQNSIDQDFRNMDIKFLGNDLDWIKTEWDLINADATEYLDAVNSAYEIQKLQGKYTELLNGSNDLLIQQKITAQMNEQLGFLREQENLSAHDVAYANAKLEALQKQIALEEAQRNKSQMKLRRDSQGNYSYVYTANQDDIADKEAAALDAQNNLYNMEKDYMLEQGQNYLSTYEKFKNAMNEVANNTEISAEERAKRMAALQEAMEKQLNQIVEETTKTQGRLTEEFLNLVDMLTEENKSDLQDTYDAIKEGSFDAFDQVDNRIVDSFHLIVDNADKTQQYIGETVDGIEEAWYEFGESIKEVSSEASTDIENVGNEINKVNDALGSLSSTQQEFIDQLKTDAKDVEKYMGTLDDYREKIWNLEKGMSDYKAKVDELNKQNQALQQEKAQMSVQIANLQQSSSSSSSSGGSSGSNGGSGGNSGGFGGTQYSKGQLTEGIAGNIWSYGTWGTDPTRSQRIKQKFGNQAGQEIINGIQKLFNGQPAYGYNYAPDKWKTDGMGYYKKFSYSSFDTGGYTGTWNAADSLPNSNAGRLAVLHQKELVLNAQDTENILRAVYAVRDLAEGLKVNQLDNIMSFTSQMPDITIDNEKEIKQDVHITADFPNVHDGREIEQALLSLNEQAVQYAFKSH